MTKFKALRFFIVANLLTPQARKVNFIEAQKPRTATANFTKTLQSKKQVNFTNTRQVVIFTKRPARQSGNLPTTKPCKATKPRKAFSNEFQALKFLFLRVF